MDEKRILELAILTYRELVGQTENTIYAEMSEDGTNVTVIEYVEREDGGKDMVQIENYVVVVTESRQDVIFGFGLG